MKTTRSTTCRNAFAAVRVAAMLTAFSAAITARATLKYQPGDYVQDGLVMHLDGIANVGAGLPHNPSANVWANLADENNPAGISESNSSGWRNGTGYYFNYDGSPSCAQLSSAAPAMTQATFELACDVNPAAQTATSWGPRFISAANDMNIHISGPSDTTLRFKSNDWTGNVNDGAYRAQIPGWGWKQASFTFGAAGAGGLKSYENGVLVQSVARSTATEGSIPATQWMVANKNGQFQSSQQLTGIMKSIRIYNRALTADEVKANADIDAARFEGVMPVTNAVVATSVAGAFGNEVPGVYAVDGSHVFTARPFAKVGSSSYVCTGCIVERWENGTWGAAETCDGVFAAVVSESEKVRITWQWAATAATLGTGIDAYATDGIKVWYDGICNVGKGLPHASAPSAWRELALNKTANISTNANSHWTSDGYYFAVGPNNEKSYVYLRELVSLGTVGTIELASQTEASEQTAAWAKYLTFGYTSTSWNASYENGMAIQVNGKQTFLRLNDDAWTGNAESQYTGTQYANWNYRANTSQYWGGKHAVFVVDTDNHRTYLKGVRDQVKPCRTTVKEMPAALWMIGNTYYNGTVGNDQLVGTIKAVRAYNRVLSDAEISRHYSIDVWRFDGEMPVSNAVEVVADPRGLAGREQPGVYFPQGGWGFTAGTATQTVNGVSYAPAGYILETWDPVLSSWQVQGAYDSASYTSPAAAPFPSVRLIWKWEPVAGIRRAADYDVGDYVQGGLVGWLDGIRNAGPNLPHDSAATTWIDLSTRKSEVTLRTNDSSHWTDDGYYFDIGTDGTSPSYAYLRQKLSLGTNGTIEIASYIDNTKLNTNNVADFVARVVSYTTGSSSGKFTETCVRVQSRTQNNLNWNADHWSDTVWQNRVNIPAPWDRRHASFVMDTGTYSSYAKGVLAQSQTRGSVVTMPSVFWMIGSRYNYSDAKCQLTGTMKALRLYNRPLSAAEIAQNYKVDVARFDGALLTTNVVVAASDYNGTLVADAYEVLGTWTFTGAPSPVTGKLPNRVKVWTFENGSWGRPEIINEGSYTYDPASSPAKVMIEFGKINPLMMILR